MNRRALLQRLTAIIAAVSGAPAVRAEASPEDTTVDVERLMRERDNWEAEALRWCQNTGYWRDQYEALTENKAD